MPALPAGLLPAAAFAVGLVLGSFFAATIVRVSTKTSIIYPPSHCPHCKHPLAPWELIPVLSYFALRGRCTACKTPISPFYPTVELLSGLSALTSYFAFGPTLSALITTLLTGALIITLGVCFKTHPRHHNPSPFARLIHPENPQDKTP